MKPTATIQANFYCALRDACFRTIARLLLVSYLLFSIRPAIPVILDNLAHRYSPEQHFRLVHSHGGSEHVHYEVQKAMKEDAQEGKDQRIKIVFDDLVCLNEEFGIAENILPEERLNHNTALRACFSSFDILPDFPPPKA